MATQTQTVICLSDGIPVDWTLVSAATHTIAYNSGLADGKSTSTLAVDTTDDIQLTVPSEEICGPGGTQFVAIFSFLSALNLGASTFGITLKLFTNSGVTLLGSKTLNFADNPNPHEQTFTITGLSFTNSQAQDLSIEIISQGAGWGFGDALISTDRIKSMTISYTPLPHTEKTIPTTSHTEKTISLTAGSIKSISTTSFTEKTISLTAGSAKTISATTFTEKTIEECV